MKEIELTKWDLKYISEMAHRIFIDRDAALYGHENFNAYCFTEAIKSYCASKGWIIRDGKIYENEV